MRPLIALAATLGLVLLAAPVSALSAGPTFAPAVATERCAPEPCGTINKVCWTAFHVNCVRGDGAASSTTEPRCMGPVCDAINAVCYKATKQWCLG